MNGLGVGKYSFVGCIRPTFNDLINRNPIQQEYVDGLVNHQFLCGGKFVVNNQGQVRGNMNLYRDGQKKEETIEGVIKSEETPHWLSVIAPFFFKKKVWYNTLELNVSTPDDKAYEDVIRVVELYAKSNAPGLHGVYYGINYMFDEYVYSLMKNDYPENPFKKVIDYRRGTSIHSANMEITITKIFDDGNGGSKRNYSPKRVLVNS